MIYDSATGELQANWATGLVDGTSKTYDIDVECADGAVLQAIPTEPQARWFEGMTVEARHVADPVAAWQDIVAEPYDLAPYAALTPRAFQVRFTAAADASGRKMFALYVGPALD